MRTGKLTISRGSKLAEKPTDLPALSLVPRPEYETNEAASQSDNKWLRDRLEMVERLARLHSLGLLTAPEFDAEKALVLGRSASETGTFEPSTCSPAAKQREAVTGTSLLGTLFSWKFLPIGLVAGLALSFGAQPEETMRFFDQALRLAGA
ncbi:MAG: hypothetical protein ACXW2T_03520 [Allosphingosinicella sp.]